MFDFIKLDNALKVWSSPSNHGYVLVSRKALRVTEGPRPPCPFVFDGSLWCLSSAGDRRLQSSAICPQPEPKWIDGFTTCTTMKGPDQRKASYLANGCHSWRDKESRDVSSPGWRRVGPWNWKKTIMLKTFFGDLACSFSVRSDDLIKMIQELCFFSHEDNKHCPFVSWFPSETSTVSKPPTFWFLKNHLMWREKPHHFLAHWILCHSTLWHQSDTAPSPSGLGHNRWKTEDVLDLSRVSVCVRICVLHGLSRKEKACYCSACIQ